MTELELRVVLARFEERLASLEKVITQRAAHAEDRIESLEEIQESRECYRNAEKLSQLEWLVRLVFGTSLAALVKAFFFTGGK